MEWVPRILAWAIVLGILYYILTLVRRMVTGGKGGEAMYCRDCGTEGAPQTVTRGSILIEIVLWLCFLVPGLMYSVWRLSTRKKVCTACGSAALIPPGSPVAQAAKKSIAV